VEHLRRYDRFYVPWMYEPPTGAAAWSILARLVLARWQRVLVDRVHTDALAPRSEAVAVSRAIVRAMHDEVTARGGRFLFVLLPSELDVDRIRRRREYADRWSATAEAVVPDGVPSVNLAPVMLAAPAELDRGFDGTHYGPRANRVIAAAVGRALAETPIAGDVPKER
jgi:hypothetical protein